MPTEISYRASAMTFSALQWGPPDGPLALCLHGYPDTAWTWRHLGPHLATQGWRVVAPFTRGYGPSDLAPDRCYQVGALAADANAAHEVLGGDGGAVLIGHDWGAITAYAAASAAPQRWARVVTLAVPPLNLMGGRAPLGTVLRQSRCSWYIGYQQLPWISERSLTRLIPRLWADWSPGFDASVDIAHVFAALDTPARRTAALRYYRAVARPWTHRSTYAAEQKQWLTLPSQPLLYLHGLQDGCMLAPLAQRAGAQPEAPNQLRMVEGAGHFLQLERPDLVNVAISDFLAA
jgi:pimeloyl-ACP methyl ester carboxylesterase